MADGFRQSVYNLLEQLPERKLDALKQLFWSELNYDRANQALLTRDCPQHVEKALAEPPTLFATTGQDDGFHVIYCQLDCDRLLLGPERQVITRLLRDGHDYSLFIFSDSTQTNWHFVNVRYEREGNTQSRRVFRRITIGPYERLRTATERICLLDISTLSPDLVGVSPLTIQNRHDEAFNVEAVTKRFFTTYRDIFKRAEDKISGLGGDTRRLFTQRLFNCLLFIVFLERKGWLTFGDRYDYLQALWDYHQEEKAQNKTANFYRDRLKLLFFAGLNNPDEVNIVGIRRDGFLQDRIGQVPYLNGGLFEEDELDRDDVIQVPDDVLTPALRDLFYHFNFTVTESTPLDIEVAVDPEMLGKIFEGLVTGRHETGSYYTPKEVVAFMGREAIKGHLQRFCQEEEATAIVNFVENRDAGGLKNPEQVLKVLQTVCICDPACGSGAYLLGMLHELIDLRSALFVTRGLDSLTAYQRKLEIIQTNLFGVDIDPFGVSIARLRLWLSLIVDFEGDNPPPLPNLDFKIEVGDSLTTPPPSGVSEPESFRQQQVGNFYDLKARYLTAHGAEKGVLREQIDQLRAEIAAWTPSSGTEDGFDWAVEFAEVFSLSADGKSGFDVVLANPPYVRADAQYRHILDEEERQHAIAKWQQYRQILKRSKIYSTLYEKWDLYIPFLERAWQLLCHGGQMVFIISDAYNAAKYARKSHEFFLECSTIARLDFCTDIPLFEAGVTNTILHFMRPQPDKPHTPFRFRRWGDSPDKFELNATQLPSAPQRQFGPALFRPDGQKPITMNLHCVPLESTCYISYGLQANAHDRYWQGEFTTDDCLSETKDRNHPKPFVQGKDLAKWAVQRVWYLEWGTSRAPSRFSRPTFPELHQTQAKLIAVRTPGAVPKVIYDDNHLHFDAISVGFVPWHHLKGVTNRSISKTAKYRSQSSDSDREEREKISRAFHPKYLLAVMNSGFARDWLARRRRSRIHIYPDDWKQLPIAPIPMKDQKEFVKLVDAILVQYEEHGYPLPSKVAANVERLEREIDERVNSMYGLHTEKSKHRSQP